MTDERDIEGNLLPDKNRLNGFGKSLRMLSLDELPELINILKGEMSFIGPRPLLREYLPYYKEHEKLRHSVRPGLSGLAQVSGRNQLDWDKRIQKDIEYVFNLSFAMDAKIFLESIMKIFKFTDVALDTKEAEGNFAEIRRQENI